MTARRVFEVVKVDHQAKTVDLKCGEYSIHLSSSRPDFLGIPLIKFKEHPRVGVALQVPAEAEEETITTSYGLNRPGK